MNKRTIITLIVTFILVAAASAIGFKTLMTKDSNSTQPDGATTTIPSLEEIRQSTQKVVDEPSKEAVVQQIDTAKEQAAKEGDTELEAQLQMEKDFAENTPVHTGTTEGEFRPENNP